MCAHSLCHLIGHDHETKAEFEVMIKEEHSLLDQYNLLMGTTIHPMTECGHSWPMIFSLGRNAVFPGIIYETVSTIMEVCYIIYIVSSVFSTLEFSEFPCQKFNIMKIFLWWSE